MTPRNQLSAITACTLWASAFVGVKYGLQFMPIFLFAGMRFLLAGAMQLPVKRGPILPLFRRASTWWIAAFNTFLLYTLFFTGLSLARGAQAAILCGASPLVAGAMAHYWMPDDRMDPRKAFALLLGLGGIALIALASNPFEPVGRRELLGLGLLLMTSFVSSFGNILVAKAKQHNAGQPIDPIALNSAQMLIGGAVLLLIGLIWQPWPDHPPPPGFWGTLLYLAFLSAAAFAIWFTLLQTEKVSRLNIWKFLVPVLGATFAWLLLPDESPDPASLAGMALVAAAVLVGTSAGRRTPTRYPSGMNRKTPKLRENSSR